MQTIQEYLGVPKEWKVKENIKHEILLMPSPEDIKNADQRNPTACALHNTACRVFNIPNCLIGGRTAFIPQRNAKGKYYIAKMTASDQTRKAIRIFDKTGKMPLGGFRFIPLSVSNQKAATKAYEKRRLSRPHKGRSLPGEGKPRQKRHRLVTRSVPHLERQF